MDYIEEKKNYELLLDSAPEPIQIAKFNWIKERQELEELKTAKYLENEFELLRKQQEEHTSGVQNILRTTKALLIPVLALSASAFAIHKVVDELTKFRVKYSPLEKEEYETLTQPDVSDVDVKYKGSSTATRIKNKIIAEAKKQGVDPAYALAVAETESHFNPKAKSSVGAIGVFQLMPNTAKGLGVNPYDEDQNIYGGIKLLKGHLAQYKGDKRKALAAYNWGSGNLARYGIDNAPAETKNHYKKIMEAEQRYKKELSNIQQKAQKEIQKKEQKQSQKPTNAGKFTKVKDNTKYGTYYIDNPNKARGHVLFSDRVQAYLKDVGGTGKITSGAEGEHASGVVSHGSGNKIDVSAYNVNSDAEWAKVAIPFLKNKNTAFVCFEDFSKKRFEAIQKIIYSQISAELKKKCDSKCLYGWGDRGGKFLDYKANYGTGLHLDIGILPTSYSFVNQTKKSSSYSETNSSENKATKGNNIKQPVKDNVNKAVQQPKQAQAIPNKVATALPTNLNMRNKSDDENLIDIQTINT